MSALVSKYDPQRTLRFAIFGMAMGPVIGESGGGRGCVGGWSLGKLGGVHVERSGRLQAAMVKHCGSYDKKSRPGGSR